MEYITTIVSYTVVAGVAFLAFYLLYKVMQAESAKNTCPHPECGGNIKYYKQYIYDGVYACEICHRGLLFTPITAKRVSDVELLHAIWERIDDNVNDQIDIGTLNYLHRLEGIVEARIQDQPSVEVADAS